MAETSAIELAKRRGPATVETLREDLAALGVVPGEALIVHTSLSRLGWVCGGPAALIEALRQAIGPRGTLVMPTHSAALSDPSHWSNTPVPESWHETIRQNLPAFDPLTTPTYHMGVAAETFRSWPDVRRSDHPIGSFAALGPAAETIVSEHPLEEVFGEKSPLGRLYELGASILLLGVGHENNTSLHLAESRAGVRRRSQGSPIRQGGARVWKTYQELEHDSDDFPAIAMSYRQAGGTERRGAIAAGEGSLTPMREIVDFATDWFSQRTG